MCSSDLVFDKFSGIIERAQGRLCTFALAGVAAIGLGACGPAEPTSSASQPDMRRLTDRQYHNIVADLFGSDIEVGGRTDPLLRTDGLLAVGARTARITPAGSEQYYLVAKSIAAQVTDKSHREALIPCQPAAADAPDDACAKIGRAHV